MEIGKPVSDALLYKNKYAAIWQAVAALKNGDWLPVTVDSHKAANLLYISAKTNRTKSMEAHVNGLVVYIRPKH